VIVLANKNSKIHNAVFFKDSRKPKCPICQYSLDELKIIDYGVEDDNMFFVSPCGMCDKPSKYFTDGNHYTIKTKIVERKNKK
jgi:uncharacterized protein with PIN domain